MTTVHDGNQDADSPGVREALDHQSATAPGASGWFVVHVTPTGDLIEHSLDDECACGPSSEPVKRDDGSVGWVIVHHSLDGREGRE